MQLLSSLVLSAVISQVAAKNTPESPAHPVSEPIRLDGVLDEPIWASVPTLGRLLQQEPNPESEPTEETELGFVPRVGIRKISPFVSFRPRAREIGIRRFNFEFFPELIYSLDGRLLDYRIFTAPLNLRTESQEHVEINVIPEQETLDEPFEIHSGVIIPTGEYRWNRYRVMVNSATKRPWVVQAAYWWGSFFSGHRRQINLGFTLKPSPNLRFEFRSERNDITLEEGEFYTQVFELGADFNFSPRISWANLVQYDNESHILGFQSRFRWILKPGNDLFVVFNRGWEDIDNRFMPAFDRGTVKFQYTFRL